MTAIGTVLCPLCDETLLERPRLNWSQFRNCAEHSKGIEAVIASQGKRMSETAVTYEVRSIRDRYRAAAEVLHRRHRTWSTEAEEAFKDKMFELAEIFERENPGKEAPNLFYDADGLLAIRWPRNFWVPASL